jgi:hypothetical protein
MQVLRSALYANILLSANQREIALCMYQAKLRLEDNRRVRKSDKTEVSLMAIERADRQVPWKAQKECEAGRSEEGPQGQTPAIGRREPVHEGKRAQPRGEALRLHVGPA